MTQNEINLDYSEANTRGKGDKYGFKMLVRHEKRAIIRYYLISFMMSFLLSVYVITPKDILSNSWYWCLAKLNPVLTAPSIKLGLFSIPLNIKIQTFAVPFRGKTYYVSPQDYLNHKKFIKDASSIFLYAKKSAYLSSALSLFILFFLSSWLILRKRKLLAKRFIRGSKLDSAENVAKEIKKKNLPTDIHIDGMPITVNSETRHFLLHGSTGSGKTQLILKFLKQIRNRGDKAIIYDPSGAYIEKFYCDDRDKILNPSDARSELWDLWHEAKVISDFESISLGLSTNYEIDAMWINAIKTILENAAFNMRDQEDRSLRKLLKKLLTAEAKDLFSYLSCIESAILTNAGINDSEKYLFEVLTNYLEPLKLLVSTENVSRSKFSIKDWLKNESAHDWLFLSADKQHNKLSTSLLAMWLSIAMNSLSSLDENPNKRIWFVCDELVSLPKLSHLASNISSAGKYGGCFILSIQSYPQLESIYGKDEALKIIDLMNTSFFFRSPSLEVAEFVSRALGSQELSGICPDNVQYSSHHMASKFTEPVVTAAEIMNLGSMKCYARLLDSPHIALFELLLDNDPPKSSSFISNSLELNPEIEGLIDKKI